MQIEDLFNDYEKWPEYIGSLKSEYLLNAEKKLKELESLNVTQSFHALYPSDPSAQIIDYYKLIDEKVNEGVDAQGTIAYPFVYIKIYDGFIATENTALNQIYLKSLEY